MFRFPRTTLVKWLDEPFFNEIVGSYVRFSIGEHEGKSVYRMVRIDGVENHHRSYKLDDKGIILLLLFFF